MQMTMKKIYMLVLSMLTLANLKAQVVQYGSVVEMNSNGKSLSGVSVTVSSEHDCQPTTTDSKGLFRLCFSEHQAGDVIHGLRAKKHGYEVVNLHVTRDGWTLTTNDSLKIVMAPVGKLTEARLKYYDIIETACVARFDSTMSFLNEQYAQQNISTAEFQYWKVQAETELRDAYKNMEEYADAFARINTDDMDENTQIIYNKLSFNDIDGAVAMVAGDSYETVLQAYNNFSAAYPMSNEIEAVAALDSVGVATAEVEISEELQKNILILQTYIDLFEKDFGESSARYAKSCLYLSTIYRQLGWNEASTTFINKALKMYELMGEIEGKDYNDEIEKIKNIR